jgi:hypothetical protein
VTLQRSLYTEILSEEAEGGLGAVEGLLGREQDPSLSVTVPLEEERGEGRGKSTFSP